MEQSIVLARTGLPEEAAGAARQKESTPWFTAPLMDVTSTPRRAQHRKRFGTIETPIIQRAAGDRAFELAGARLD